MDEETLNKLQDVVNLLIEVEGATVEDSRKVDEAISILKTVEGVQL